LADLGRCRLYPRIRQSLGKRKAATINPTGRPTINNARPGSMSNESLIAPAATAPQNTDALTVREVTAIHCLIRSKIPDGFIYQDLMLRLRISPNAASSRLRKFFKA
jgi:hypothetical protein